MVITIPAPAQGFRGPRPIQMGQDIPQIVSLLELVFGESMGDGWLTAGPAFLWQFNPLLNRLVPGYVWEENGRIVGNVTLLPTESTDRYIIVNVAVHPDYRQRGIARALMQGVIELVRSKRGRHIVLQVVKDNTSAVHLYETLQFQKLGSVASWATQQSRLHAIPAYQPEETPVAIRELKGSEWEKAYALDVQTLHPFLNWPEPLAPDAYRKGFWRWLGNLANGRQTETWVTEQDNQLTGMATILSEFGRAHTLSLRIHPRWQGQLERPLFAKMVRRLRYLPRRAIHMDHLDGDVPMNQLLTEANFSRRRVLTHMHLDLQKEMRGEPLQRMEPF